MAEGFYVTVVDGSRRGFLLGPFDTHDEALDKVESVRHYAEEHNSRAQFYGFGITRVVSDHLPPGSLNARMNHPQPTRGNAS